MKGREILEKIENMEKDIQDADKLAAYFKEHPEEADKIAQAANMGKKVNSLINRISCEYEQRKNAIKAALYDAEIKV